MGLQCSILGHSFEPDGVERERETQGSEVVTTEREIERCTRCGKERVVSESTEVTAVVDAEEVALDDDASVDAPGEESAEAAAGDAGELIGPQPAGEDANTGETGGEGSASGGASADVTTETDDIDVASDADEDLPDDGGAEIIDETVDSAEDDEETARDVVAEAPTDDGAPEPDPDGEDAVILSDDTDGEAAEELERAPGQWPDDADESAGTADSEPIATAPDEDTEPVDEQSLSGITVPDGRIVCPDCDFSVQAHSGYREGDPCPDCSAWLESERNR